MSESIENHDFFQQNVGTQISKVYTRLYFKKYDNIPQLQTINCNTKSAL